MNCTTSHQPGTTCYVCHQYIPYEDVNFPVGTYPYISLKHKESTSVVIHMSVDMYAELLEMLEWFRKEIKKEDRK